MGKRVGYIRVSTVGQNQIRQLDGIDVDKTFTDRASGKDTVRPELAAMLDYVRTGDEIIVHSLDRLSRNLDDLRTTVSTLTGSGVTIRFVKEGLTFTGDDSAMATLLLSVMGAFAEFERSLIRERQAEGIAKAKRKGVYRGGKPAFNQAEIAELVAAHEAGTSITQLAKEKKVTRQTIHRYIKAWNQQRHPQPAASKRPKKPSKPTRSRKPPEPSRPKKAAVKSFDWVVELIRIDRPASIPVVWSGHSTKLGAVRMVASLEKQWQRWQSRAINGRWVWQPAEANNRKPLFDKRATAVRQASVQATDQPPPPPDAAIVNEPVNATTAQLVIGDTQPVIIENPDGLTETANNWYVQHIYQYLFGPTPNISHEIITHTETVLDDLGCTAHQPWTIPATQIYQTCLESSHLQNLTQLGLLVSEK